VLWPNQTSQTGRQRSNLGQPGLSPQKPSQQPLLTPWISQRTLVVNPWSKTRSNPTATLMSMNVLWNLCRVLQISPKHFKIYLYESCPACWGTQLPCRLPFQILSGKGWKTWSTGSTSCSPRHGGIQCWQADSAKSVKKNTLEPL
jgi:hypothetical protein